MNRKVTLRPSLNAFRIIKLACILAVSCSASVLPAQDYLFSGYSIGQGLSQSVVNCLYQDSKGYIWIGTQNGLNRFDGYTFEKFIYRPGDTTSISNNWIFSLAEDRESNLWIGTKGGLNKFLRDENKFCRVPLPSGLQKPVADYIYDILVARDGKVLINTPPALAILDTETGTGKFFFSGLEHDIAVKDTRIPLLEDDEGLVWVASTRGLSSFDRQTKQFRHYLSSRADPSTPPVNNITALYDDHAGNIWVGTTAGLCRFDKKKGRFTRIEYFMPDGFSFLSGCFRSIKGDGSGHLWLGTEGGGLIRMKPSDTGLAKYDRFIITNSGLAHNIVQALLVDRSRNLWIGTLNGISKTDLKKPKFRLYRKSGSPNSVDLLGNVVAGLYKARDGKIWIGNWGQGLNIYDRKTGKVEHFSVTLAGNHHIPNDFVHVIFEDRQRRIWLGTRDGLLVYDSKGNGFLRPEAALNNKKAPDLRGLRISTIIQDRRGDYWFGTQSGLYRVQLPSGLVVTYHEEAAEEQRISGNLVYCLLEDRDGLIWIATLNGLDVFDPVKGLTRHFSKDPNAPNALSDNLIITLSEDFLGDIWIGTGSYVNKYVKKDSSFIYYSNEQGVPDNNIFEIVEDKEKNLWFGTGHGLARFIRETGRFRTYTVEEGLQSLEFNLRAACCSADGEVFFGGMNGVNSFYPDSVIDNPYVPEIVFTSLSRTGKEGKESTLIGNDSTLRLKYNDHSFSVGFAALEFTNPEKNRFAYQMEGISDDWIQLDHQHFVSFSNLPPGNYVLRVKCANNDGVWNDKPAVLNVVITPPWWKSRLAYIIYFILLIATVLLIMWINERHLLREKRLLERKVQQRTAQIEQQSEVIMGKNAELKALNDTKDKFFSIIAHDLRNPFNTILGLSDLLLSNSGQFNHEKIENYISAIRKSSEQAYGLLENLLLWSRSQTGRLAFCPESFNIRDRIEENLSLVSSQADRKQIRLTVTSEQEYHVTADINMTNTILRNLVTNAVKFTPQGGQVNIRVTGSGGFCEISVADTGIGISPGNMDRLFVMDNRPGRRGTDQEPGTGLGLILCREFVEKNGGRIRAESTEGKGSVFSFTLPLSV